VYAKFVFDHLEEQLLLGQPLRSLMFAVLVTWLTFSFFKLISKVFNIWLHKLYKTLNFSLIALVVLLRKMTVSFFI